MANKTNLYIDTTKSPTQALVRGLTNNSPAKLNDMVSMDTYDIVLQFVSNGERDSLSGDSTYQVTLEIGERAGQALAYTTLGVSASYGFTGSLSLATNQMSASLGSSDYGDYILEATVFDITNGVWRRYLQTDVRVWNEVDTSSMAPVSASQYYTKTESDSRFFLKNADLTSSFFEGGNSFGSNATLGTKDAYSLDIITNNTANRINIQSDGNVGIGQTGVSANKLAVNGSIGATHITASGYLRGKADLTNITASSGTITTLQTTQVTSSTYRIGAGGIVNSSGYIGIGTANPSNPIHIRDGSAQNLLLLESSAATNTYQQYKNSTPYTMYTGLNNLGNWAVKNATSLHTTPHLTVASSSGFVGVNVTTPANQLDVSGQARFTGAITASAGVVGNLTGSVAGAVTGSITGSGYFTPRGSNLNVVRVDNTNGSFTSTLPQFQNLYSDAVATDAYCFYNRHDYTGAADKTGYTRGAMFSLRNSAAYNLASENSSGGLLGNHTVYAESALANASGRCEDLNSYYAACRNTTAGGHIKSRAAYYAYLESNAGTVITSSYGLFIRHTENGTVTNKYGVYQEHSSAKNYFAGYVSVNTTNATSRLTCGGSTHLESYTGIGVAPVGSAMLNLVGSATGYSSFRVNTGSAAPSSPVEGDMWNDSTYGLAVRRAGLTGYLPMVVQRQTATVSRNSATGGAQTLLSPALTFPSNFFKAGTTIRVRAWGYHTVVQPPTHSVQVILAVSGAVQVNLLDFGAISMTTNTTNGDWHLDAQITVRSIGASGTMVADGELEYNLGGTETEVHNSTNGTTTVNTTVDQTLLLTVTMAGGDSSDKWECQQASVEVL